MNSTAPHLPEAIQLEPAAVDPWNNDFTLGRPDLSALVIFKVIEATTGYELEQITASDIPVATPEELGKFLEDLVKAGVKAAARAYIFEIAAGVAFKWILALELYRLTDRNLGRYCRRVFKRDRATIFGWMKAGEMSFFIPEHSTPPENYSQLLPLVMVSEESRAEVWQAAVNGRGGLAPSARFVRQIAREMGVLTEPQAKSKARGIGASIAEASQAEPVSALASPHQALSAVENLEFLLRGRLKPDTPEFQILFRLICYHQRQVANLEEIDLPIVKQDAFERKRSVGWKIQPIAKAVNATTGAVRVMDLQMQMNFGGEGRSQEISTPSCRVP